MGRVIVACVASATLCIVLLLLPCGAHGELASPELWQPNRLFGFVPLGLVDYDLVMLNDGTPNDHSGGCLCSGFPPPQAAASDKEMCSKIGCLPASSSRLVGLAHGTVYFASTVSSGGSGFFSMSTLECDGAAGFWADTFANACAPSSVFNSTVNRQASLPQGVKERFDVVRISTLRSDGLALLPSALTASWRLLQPSSVKMRGFASMRLFPGPVNSFERSVEVSSNLTVGTIVYVNPRAGQYWLATQAAGELQNYVGFSVDANVLYCPVGFAGTRCEMVVRSLGVASPGLVFAPGTDVIAFTVPVHRAFVVECNQTAEFRARIDGAPDSSNFDMWLTGPSFELGDAPAERYVFMTIRLSVPGDSCMLREVELVFETPFPSWAYGVMMAIGTPAAGALCFIAVVVWRRVCRPQHGVGVGSGAGAQYQPLGKIELN